MSDDAGTSPEAPVVMNLKEPDKAAKNIRTNNAEVKLVVDPKKMAEAAERLGADKFDVLSIGGFRNSKGEFVPDYSSVRIESRNNPGVIERKA